MFLPTPFSLLSSMNSFAKRFILEEEKRRKLRKFSCQTFAKKLLARFASYVDHINFVFVRFNDDFFGILHSLFGYVYSETSNEFVHNILMNLTDCRIQIAIYLL